MPNVYFLAASNNPHPYIGLFFHIIFAIALFLGFILLTAWMIKNLKGKQLVWWAGGLMVVGLLGMVITAVIMQQAAPKNMMNQQMAPGFQDQNSPENGYFMMNNSSMMGNNVRPGYYNPEGVPGGVNMMRNPVHPSVQAMMNFLPQFDQKCTTADCDSYLMTVMAQMRTHMSQPASATQQVVTAPQKPKLTK